MSLKTHTIKINLPGGIVPAGDFYQILQAAEKAGVASLRIGNRQQLFLEVAGEKLQGLSEELVRANIIFELNADVHPNIVSSYVTEDVFYHANWLREGVYKDILDGFDYRPQLKINLVDNNQTFVPFFTGNLNFIASDTSNYWYLYIRFPKTNIIYCWPSLVYSEDIPGLSSLIERIIFAHKDKFYDQPQINGTYLHDIVSAAGNFVLQPFESPLKLPEFTLPYYEGFNRYDNKLWLGIYRRDELFSLPFLKDLCRVSLQTRIGQLYTTPWKSLVIKGIGVAERHLWDGVLGRHRINVRHASNELNWQIEDRCQFGLDLKTDLVNKFNEEDVRTYRLCFAIKTQPKTGLFGSIIIRTQHTVAAATTPEQELYEILYTRDFNPNSKEFISFKNRVTKEALSETLIELCNFYYELKNEPDLLLNPVYLDTEEGVESTPVQQVYQCKHCFTIYDYKFGDPLNNIAAGTPFEALDAYQCTTCEGPKEDFVLVAAPQPYIAYEP
ncbi:rubredoxin domain-containing protein [Cesiribacter sp. SM1]|uniref:rubredoxin domain-containing protein n=1 Tax=Cesiribacter sp. SM1 TaxID=2861196 RepID=UPI001CD19E0A|nr:rubredoxin domain-containing protein [Cesiribacter sp. SM1]